MRKRTITHPRQTAPMPPAVEHPGAPMAFFGLVTSLSLPFWILGAATTAHAQRLPIQLPLSALMCLCPSTAALLLTHRTQGRAGVRALLHRAIDAQRITNPWWYVPILGLMPVVMGLSYGLLHARGRPLPPPQIPFQVLPLFALVFWVSAVSEELGWAGYATDLLVARWGSMRASLILGGVWAAWHVIPYLQADRSVPWVLWQCGATIALRVLMGRLYATTNGSVHALILFHMMINVSTFAVPRYGSSYDPMVTGLLLGGVALAWRCAGAGASQ